MNKALNFLHLLDRQRRKSLGDLLLRLAFDVSFLQCLAHHFFEPELHEENMSIITLLTLLSPNHFFDLPLTFDLAGERCHDPFRLGVFCFDLIVENAVEGTLQVVFQFHRLRFRIVDAAAVIDIGIGIEIRSRGIGAPFNSLHDIIEATKLCLFVMCDASRKRHRNSFPVHFFIIAHRKDLRKSLEDVAAHACHRHHAKETLPVRDGTWPPREQRTMRRCRSERRTQCRCAAHDEVEKRGPERQASHHEAKSSVASLSTYSVHFHFSERLHRQLWIEIYRFSRVASARTHADVPVNSSLLSRNKDVECHCLHDLEQTTPNGRYATVTLIHIREHIH